jgi:hypothetical protein
MATNYIFDHGYSYKGADKDPLGWYICNPYGTVFLVVGVVVLLILVVVFLVLVVAFFTLRRMFRHGDFESGLVVGLHILMMMFDGERESWVMKLNRVYK